MFSMTRFRTIKKYGDTWVIKLNPIDAVDFGLEEGDQIDIEDITILKNKQRRQKK